MPVFQRVSMNIALWRLVKPHANYCVDILKARWLCPAFAESYWLLRVTLSKELWLFMFEMRMISGTTDGWQGCKPPPPKLNVKTAPYLACILVFTILLVSVDVVYCVFRGVFPWFRVFV